MPVKKETSVVLKEMKLKEYSKKKETIKRFERICLKKISLKKGNLLKLLTYHSDNKLN